MQHMVEILRYYFYMIVLVFIHGVYSESVSASLVDIPSPLAACLSYYSYPNLGSSLIPGQH
jgi:hypothetical protein